MSNVATSWASDLEGLPAGAKLVLMLLAECHNGKTGQCNPGNDWICRKTGYKTRMLARHLADLEARKLIERETVSLGRARGKQTSFVLKIGKSDTQLHVHQNTRAPEYTCNAVPLEVHSSACAYNKEEPEGTGTNTSGKTALEEIWPHWSAKGRKRSSAKAKLIERLNRLAKTQDLSDVAKACRMYAKATDGEYHAGLQVFLKSGQWENWIGEDKSIEQPKSLEDWKQAAANYVELNIWPVDLGPPPHQPDCKAPVGLLKSIAKKMQGHARHTAIINNIGRAA